MVPTFSETQDSHIYGEIRQVSWGQDMLRQAQHCHNTESYAGPYFVGEIISINTSQLCWESF